MPRGVTVKLIHQFLITPEKKELIFQYKQYEEKCGIKMFACFFFWALHKIVTSVQQQLFDLSNPANPPLMWLLWPMMNVNFGLYTTKHESLHELFKRLFASLTESTHINQPSGTAILLTASGITIRDKLLVDRTHSFSC